ncbi:MAG: hypothetical protein Q8P38_05580, partial [Candidatus Nanopelagicales bacterium]|nr:hypothetical protein [Candidatus Nanopelagicales bacterium]
GIQGDQGIQGETGPEPGGFVEHEAATTTVHGITDTSAILLGALGATDNVLLRSNGTGGQTAQGSGISVSDANAILCAVTDATAVPFTSKGYTAQTANLAEWQNSADTVLAKVTAAGSGQFGGPLNSFGSLDVEAWQTTSGSCVLEGYSGALYNYQSQSMILLENLYYDGAAWKYKRAAAASYLSVGNDNIHFLFAPAGSADAAATLTKQLTLKAGGVGFGAAASDIENWDTSSGSHALEMYSSSIFNYRTTNLLIQQNAYYGDPGAGLNWRYKAAGTAGRLNLAGTGLIVNTAVSGAEDAAITWVEQLNISTTAATFAQQIIANNGVSITNAKDIVLGTTTGTKLGTGATQKLAFWGLTPAVQPTAVADATDAADVITQLNALLSRMRTIGLIAA